jgi:hypothetical protein
MLVDLDNEGEAIMGIAFIKLLEAKLPSCEAIFPKVREVALWVWEHSLTDAENEAVRDAGLLDECA